MYNAKEYVQGVSYETFMVKALCYDRYDLRIGDWSLSHLVELQDNVVNGLDNLLGWGLEYDQREKVKDLIVKARKSQSKDELCIILREGIRVINTAKK